jgi:protein gp37
MLEFFNWLSSREIPLEGENREVSHDPSLHVCLDQTCSKYLPNWWKQVTEEDWGRSWPLNNVWIGITAENQQMADERIPLLMECPAVLRFISIEPMLGPIDLRNVAPCDDFYTDALDTPDGDMAIQWVIVGGESGPDARPMHPNWVRSLRDQCLATNTPFFYKQWGEWCPADQRDPDHWDDESSLRFSEQINAGETHRIRSFLDGTLVGRFGKKLSGNTLDGKIWEQFPETKGA